MMTRAATAPCHRVLIVDDEPLARASLRGWLEHTPDPPAVAEAADGPAAVAHIHARQPDLVFLDIQMPGMDGFSVIRNVGLQAMPMTVFVTAHDAYAVRAFRAHALDYLLKPVDEEQLRAVYRRARSRWSDHAELAMLQSLRALLTDALAGRSTTTETDDPQPVPAAGMPLDHIAVRVREGVRLIDVADVDWIEAADDYAYVHTAGSAHLVRQRLRFFEERLDRRHFIRIHRSTIVNLARVRGFVMDGDGAHVALLASGERLRVSRTRRGQLEARLGQPL